MFFYNPETIIKVSLLFPHERIEYLLMKKRYDEAMDLLNQEIKQMSKQSHYLL